MALIGAGTALYTAIQVHAQAAVLAQQVTHLVDGFLFPVINQFTREAQLLLMIRFGDKGAQMRSSIRYKRIGNSRVFPEFWCLKIGHAIILVLCPISP